MARGIKVVRDESPRARLANEAAENYRQCHERVRSLLKQTNTTGFDSYRAERDASILMIELKRHVPHDGRFHELMREVTEVRRRIKSLSSEDRRNERRNRDYEQLTARVDSAERRMIASFRGPINRKNEAVLRRDLEVLLMDLNKFVGGDARLRKLRDTVWIMRFDPANFRANLLRSRRNRDAAVMAQVVPQGIVSSGRMTGGRMLRGGHPGGGKRS